VRSVKFLTFVQVTGSAATFWLYARLTVGAWVFTYFPVPETKGRTLEQIQAFWRAQESPRSPLVEPRSRRPAGVQGRAMLRCHAIEWWWEPGGAPWATVGRL
jgi:hypothetical protein